MTCKEGLIDNAKTALHLGTDADPIVWEKVLEIQEAPLPTSTISTDDVTTLEDDDKQVATAGVFDNGKIALKGLQISGSAQQKSLYEIHRSRECRPYKIVLSDEKATTYQFCAVISGWTPNTAASKKNRLDFELTISGKVTVSDADGPYIPVTP